MKKTAESHEGCIYRKSFNEIKLCKYSKRSYVFSDI